MHRKHAGTGLDHTNSLLRQRASALTVVVRYVSQRVRLLLQPSPQHHTHLLKRRLAAGVVVTAAVIGSVPLAQHVIQQVELHSSVAPLAPAPAPPAPPRLAASPRHHLLHNLHPLAGLASWYGSVWNGRTTASGETYDESQLTAAHRTLPLGTLVRVTNLRSMHSVIVRINDRGAFAPGRIIDLSSAAANKLGMLEQGLAQVKLEVLRKR